MGTKAVCKMLIKLTTGEREEGAQDGGSGVGGDDVSGLFHCRWSESRQTRGSLLHERQF